MTRRSISTLHPIRDQKVIERIEHAKVCDNYSTIENICLGHSKEREEWYALSTEERLKIAKG